MIMQDELLYPGQLDDEAALLRSLLRRPPWLPYGDDVKEDTATRTLFRRFRPGQAPHALSPELRGAVWERVWAQGTGIPEALRDDEASLSRAVDHAALVLHLLARGPAARPNGLDFGAACRRAVLSDTRFVRLMGTPQPLRLEALSRVMQRLERTGAPLRWFANETEQYSRSWNVRHTSTDEVWPMLNFLFGYDPDPSIARWATGFFRTVEPEPEAAAPTIETL